MRQVSVTLTDEAAIALDEVVGAGAFASVDEAINASVLETLADADDIVGSQQFTDFLHRVAIPVGQRLKQDPTQGLAVDEVRRGLTARSPHDQSSRRPT